MEQMILASASPRRLELLRQVGIEPVVEPSHVQEVITSTIPGEVVMELSRQKAEDIAGLHRGEPVIVLGADTVVAADGKILGKPKDREDAILVFCGENSSQNTSPVITFFEETEVCVFPMTDRQVEAYVDTKEPMDKAGAYGIQGKFAAYVKGIVGDYNNVVGLPVGRVCQELGKRGIKF